MKDKGKRKKLIIAAAAIAVIAGLGIGTFAFRGNHKATSVEVYPVSSLTGWGELTAQNEQTTGTIVDQFSQDVKMLGDYPLNRVHVRKGQKVKKGDILVTYNARRQELELKLKEIEVRRRERDVQIRENSLETLRKTGKDPYTGASDVDGDTDSILDDDDDSMNDDLDYTDDDASLPGSLFDKDALLGLTVRAEDPEEGTTQAAPEATTQAPEEEQTEASTEATESTEVPDTPQLADIFESMKDGVVPGTCYEVTDEGLVVYVKGDQGTPDVAGQAILDAIQRAGDTKSPLTVIIKRYSNQEALDNGEEPNKQIEISMGSYVTSSIDADSTYSLEQIEKRLGNINNAKKVTITSKSTNATKKVTKGSSYTYQLNLDGKKVSNGVRWSISGNKKKKTSIDSTTGTLTVASNETAKKLRIIATLNGVSRYITVKVGAASNSDDDDDDDDDNGGNGGNKKNNNRTDRDNTNINTDDDSDITDAPLTGEELREAIADRESELEEKKLKLQEAEITYEEYKAKFAKATVRASMNGTVTLAKTKADNPSAGESIVVVKSRSGVYVEINVNEVNLDKIHYKGKLTCTKSNEDSYEEELDVDDYEGKRYTAIVTDIADYPNSAKVTTDNYYDYSTVNNPDTSYYTVVGTIKNGNGLNPGDRMKVTFSAKDMDQEANVGIEVMTPFVRQDGRRYYVYKRDDKKRLVKQYVTLGNSANGYSQVLDGITEEDYIAFPYSKTELEGARTKKCDEERTQEVIETLMNSQEFTYY